MLKFKYFLVENRISFLKKQYLDDIEKKNLKWKDVENVDPSRKKTYLQWIIKQVLRTDKEYLKKEDFYKVTDALKVFDKNKHLLENRKERDINYFKTYRDFIDLVDEKLICKKSGKEIKREEMQDALKQSKIIYKGSKGSIIMPKTENAACILGRGTKWCTSATDGDNKFNYYNQKGNLYIITLKNGDKYQFHIQEGELIDARDRNINFKKFDKKNPWVFDNIVFTEKEQLEAVRKHLKYIEYIKNPSESVQIAAVKQNGNVIYFIKNPSEKVQILAVSDNGYLIEYIKNPSEVVQMEAVKKYGNSIIYIDNPTKNVQMISIKKNVNNLSYIKNPTKEVQMMAVKMDSEAIDFIENPTEKVQMYVVKKDIKNIDFIKNPTEAVKKYVEENK